MQNGYKLDFLMEIRPCIRMNEAFTGSSDANRKVEDCYKQGGGTRIESGA